MATGLDKVARKNDGAVMSTFIYFPVFFSTVSSLFTSPIWGSGALLISRTFAQNLWFSTSHFHYMYILLKTSFSSGVQDPNCSKSRVSNPTSSSSTVLCHAAASQERSTRVKRTRLLRYIMNVQCFGQTWLLSDRVFQLCLNNSTKAWKITYISHTHDFLM